MGFNEGHSPHQHPTQSGLLWTCNLWIVIHCLNIVSYLGHASFEQRQPVNTRWVDVSTVHQLWQFNNPALQRDQATAIKNYVLRLPFFCSSDFSDFSAYTDTPSGISRHHSPIGQHRNNTRSTVGAKLCGSLWAFSGVGGKTEELPYFKVSSNIWLRPTNFCSSKAQDSW